MTKRKMQANGDSAPETTADGEELKGFTESDLSVANSVVKDVSVVLTRTEIQEEIVEVTKDDSVEENEKEKRVTRSQRKREDEESEVKENVGEAEEETVEDRSVEESETEKRVTRSQRKKDEEVVAAETKENDNEVKENGEEAKEVEHSDAEEMKSLVIEPEEMEPLAIEPEETEPLAIEPDETEPELQFDENSDRDSPSSRCLTRRSHLRNLPTPKTPKTEKSPTPPLDEEKTDPNESSDSITDSLSTKAEAGNDTTRADFIDDEPSAFLKSLKEKSLTDTLRGLSSRRTIHSRYIPHVSSLPISETLPYPKRASVESISSLKRKHRSTSPEQTKRMKRDASGLFSYIRSPVMNVRSRFSRDLASSTPKLTGFRNKNSLLDSEELSKIKLEVEDAQAEKKWCNIM